MLSIYEDAFYDDGVLSSAIAYSTSLYLDIYPDLFSASILITSKVCVSSTIVACNLVQNHK